MVDGTAFENYVPTSPRNFPRIVSEYLRYKEAKDSEAAVAALAVFKQNIRSEYLRTHSQFTIVAFEEYVKDTALITWYCRYYPDIVTGSGYPLPPGFEAFANEEDARRSRENLVPNVGE